MRVRSPEPSAAAVRQAVARAGGAAPLPIGLKAVLLAVRLTVRLAVLTALAVVAQPGPARADFDYASYADGSIRTILAEHGEHLQDALADERHHAIETVLSKYRILVTFGGQRRELAEDAAQMLEMLGKSLPGIPGSYLALFTHEIAVEQDGQAYWMPIQRQLLPYLDEELPRGGPVYLYVVLAGVNGRRLMLLINEFQKAQVQ